MKHLKLATLLRKARKAGYRPIKIRGDAVDYSGFSTGWMKWVMPVERRKASPTSCQRNLYWLGWCHRSKEWHIAMSAAVSAGQQLSCGCVFESKAGYKQRRSGLYTKNAPKLDKWLTRKHSSMMMRARRDNCGVERLFDTRLPGVDNVEAVTAFIGWCKWHYGEKFLNIAMKWNYVVHKPTLKGYYIVNPDNPSQTGIQFLAKRAHKFIHSKHGDMPIGTIRKSVKRRLASKDKKKPTKASSRASRHPTLPL